MFVAHCQVIRGWVMAQRGQADEGMANIREGLVGCKQTGARMGEPYYTALLAERHFAAGQLDEASAAIAQAREIVAATGEHWIEADILRLDGEISCRLAPAKAESLFKDAIHSAQEHQSRSLELRAATSLARFWQSQGRLSEAADIFAPVYDWFIEGFDTADLKAAKALLENLA